MDRIAEEILSYLGTADVENEFFMHYGVGPGDNPPGRGSGRYPEGQGETPFQHGYSGELYNRVQDLKRQGFTEKQIVEELGMKSTTEFRAKYSNAKNEYRTERVMKAKEMLASGKTRQEVIEYFGLANESTLRSWLDEERTTRANAARVTADFLKAQVAAKGMIDVGAGIERELSISETKLDAALDILKEEGYEIWNGRIQQVTNKNQFTVQRVLCPPGTPNKDIYNLDEVHTITEYKSRTDENGNEIYEKGFEYPASLDSKRVQVVWPNPDDPAHDGAAKDGLVEIRPGCKDLDLKGSNYAQVRIMVDGTHYIKGMAVYNSDLPEGVDVRFNTSKDPNTKKIFGDVFKKIKDDPDDPFGSLLKPEGGQYHYIDENGEEKLGLINKRANEGDWGDWANKVPTQMLSKQRDELISRQLTATLEDKMTQYNEIMTITNPTLRKKMLYDFAGECDGNAVDLKSVAFPRQAFQVILPIGNIGENEIYAPNYRDGEKVALIRFPHASVHEIPILTVNNRNIEGRNMMGTNPKDAVGINAKTAQQLSGADFDGDTVMVIPCNSESSSIRINAKPMYEALKTFDPHVLYDTTGKTGIKLMAKKSIGLEMGKASNLITDMTLKGATDEELVRAIKHSMVIIDAYKHKLDYHQSEVDNGIAELKRKYQGHIDPLTGKYSEGASTLISMAKKKTAVLKPQGSPYVDEETGELKIKRKEEHYIDPKTGKDRVRTIDVPLMSVTKDAYTLSSGNPVENAYAQFANTLKKMANIARLEWKKTKDIKYNAAAHAIYAEEVKDLEAQIALSEMNAPRERQAQRWANSRMKSILEENPGMEKEDIKKRANKELKRARLIFGAHRQEIVISDKAWQAIQAGALGSEKLNKIFRKANQEQLRERALPKANNEISESKQSRIANLKAQGYTNAEIASVVNVSISTVNKYS